MPELSSNPAAGLGLTAAERRRAELATGERLWLDLVLRPHRSLSGRGFRLLCAIAGAVSLLAVLRFWLLGAWPVAVLFVLDAALLFGAFRLSYASGRGFEAVQLRETALIVTRVAWTGKVASWAFNPDWARVELIAGKSAAHPELMLSQGGRRVRVGRFLPPGEREEVAAAIRAGLARRKAGAPAVPQSGYENR